MNKRFILKFFKYLTIFLTLTIIIAMVSILLIMNFTLKHLYTDLRSIEPDFFTFTQSVDKPSQYIQTLSKKKMLTFILQIKMEIFYIQTI